MKTESLIEVLSRGPIAVDPGSATRRFAIAVAAGFGLAAAAMLALLGPRHDIASALGTPMFWMKLAFPTLLAAATLAAAVRLARPGGNARAAWVTTAMVLCILEVAAVAAIVVAAPGERVAMVAGHTALPCVASIVLLALPILLATLLAMRGLAPTRLRAAGLAAGLAAGTLAAAVYALHCDESTVPFLAAWYVLGMSIPGALGAAAGPRWLRWA